MCGIAGIYNFSGAPVDPPVLRRMTDAVAHRGPDGEGHFLDGPVGLGHRRLAIIDLSPAARQPMTDDTRRFTLVYNGEIYNFRELRRELEGLGREFHTRSDGEVLLQAYAEWGTECVERFNGMFAFGIWDALRRDLFLARDRYGVKPLYYYRSGGILIFASEIKSLLQHPDVSVRVSLPALSEYFTFQNLFSDLTLFEGVHLLPAGCTLSVVGTGDTASVQQRRYWDYRFSAERFALTVEETAEELYRLFCAAVSRQLVADVPVGAYLSGGLDSGSITAVASQTIPRLCTFTAGFDLSSASGMELGFDERAASKVVSNQFKTEHYEVVLHAGDMERVLPELTWHLEDPRVGQSYPNYYAARLASRFVKVVLSGAGGDELFGGYPWRYYRPIDGIDPDRYYCAYYESWQRLIPDHDRTHFFVEDVRRAVNGHHPSDIFRAVFAGGAPALDSLEDVINAALYFESKTFLHGLLLVEDKLSMAHSLETRVPFLDNDLVDFAMRVPPRLKLRDLRSAPHLDEDEAGRRTRYRLEASADGKVVLRTAMARLMPPEVVRRAKQGFAAPDASWFRGESIDYVNRLLRSPNARFGAFIAPAYVARVLDEHSAGRSNHRLLIWSLLSFEWWLRTFC
jgi:asparagine synthase (glutamine-hydrolysing)